MLIYKSEHGLIYTDKNKKGETMPEPKSFCDKCGEFKPIVEKEERYSEYYKTLMTFELCGYCNRTAYKASFIDSPIKW
tara:strand:- start:105 stop:338 length:234 start_codon:yes stop_codon:yes gene_type:complete